MRSNWNRGIEGPIHKIVETTRSDRERSPSYRSWYTTNRSTNRSAKAARDSALNHADRISARRTEEKMRQATFSCVPMSVSHTVLLHASNSTRTSFRPCLLCAESWQRRCEGLPQRQLKIHRPDVRTPTGSYSRGFDSAAGIRSKPDALARATPFIRILQNYETMTRTRKFVAEN